jgi:KipI family sensor histidine kinase inhibitor
MDWRFYGPDAVLIRFADRLGEETFQRSRALIAELDRHPPLGLIEFIPAFTTLLLEFDPATLPEIPAEMPGLLRRLERAAQHPLPPAKLHEIPVIYDGEDLERVAGNRKLSIEEVCALHSAPTYNVYFLGFAPGFPYLGDLDPLLHTPRLPSPRLRVAAGSVAIGGEHTGIYSVETPGGWNIIGHTSVVLFDHNAEDNEAFLLRPGDRVRFVREAVRSA